MSIISAQNLSYGIGVDVILDSVNFIVNKQDRIGIVGANGAGKSTLLRLINTHYLSSINAAIPSDEHEYISADEGELAISRGVSLGYLKQREHFEPGLSVMQVMENVPLDVQKAFEESHGYDYKRAIVGFLTAMNFDESYYDREASMLSGGEKTRLALCALLVREPDILLLDEPTNHLDIPTLVWLENYLKSYRGTLLIVSHDRYFLDKCVTRIFEIENCELTAYNGNYSSYKEQKQRNFEIDMKHYEHEIAEIKRQEELISRWKQRGTEHLTKRAKSREKRLAHIVPPTRPTQLTECLKINFAEKLTSGNDVVRANDLGFSYTDALFKNVELDIKKGERICIVGENGVGKTTLLKIILGQLLPEHGRVVLGTNVMPGYYDQEQTGLHPSSTVLDEVHNVYRKYDETDLRKILGSFLFHGDDVFKKVSDLAGGEKARLALLKLMMSGSNLLIFDEPTNHLDIKAKEIFEEAVMKFPGTVIIVSHDRYLLSKVPDRILELTSGGMVSYLGKYDYYAEKSKERKAFGKGSGAKASDEADRTSFGSEALAETGAAAKASDGDSVKESWEEKKAREREERKRLKAIANAEELIASLEAEKAQLEALISDPKNASDPKALSELAEKMSETDIALEKATQEWGIHFFVWTKQK